MDHLDVPQTLGLLVVMLAAAKLFGYLAQRIGQPAVLGELVAGVVLGMSVLGLVNPHNEVLHLLAEIGVVILLFEIGLETDLRKLVHVGGESALVAIVGVALPFALGYLVCRSLGLGNLVAVVAGATLTATSVGITARVLSDLNRLRQRTCAGLCCLFNGMRDWPDPAIHCTVTGRKCYRDFHSRYQP
jgi:Kef-type K+ transport system membrane component KefB